MTAALWDTPRIQGCQAAPGSLVCRATSLTPPESMEGCAQQRLSASCNGGMHLPHTLGQQLAELQLSGPPSCSQTTQCNGAHSRGPSSSSSSGSDRCCSSSSSSDMSAPTARTHQQQNLPSSSTAAPSTLLQYQQASSAAPAAAPAGPQDLPRVTADSQQQGDESAAEPLLRDNPDRFTLSPIQHDDFWTMYKQALASFWTIDEVDLSNDMRDWQKLTAAEQHFIKYVLAFFAGSDGIVLENLAVRFMQDIQVPEVRAFYGFQIAMENIHSEMYSVLLETYVQDAAERRTLLRAINHIPVIQKKAAWALKWISSSESFAERLIAFACVEGIHFSGSFCAIFWLKKRGLMPGLTFSNELISRDEGLHTDFAVLMYQHLRHRLCESVVHQLVDEAVELEREFICEALQVAVVGMNAALMEQYIHFVADRLLVSLGYTKLYNATNPFDWMELISLQGKANFFERRVGEYQKAGVMSNRNGERMTFEQFVFTTDEDF